MSCPCGSTESFESCCGPYLSGAAKPPTAEKLMRSRYTAFVKADIDYIKKTFAPESQKFFDAAEARKWATQSEWQGLHILSTDKGGPSDKKGVVEFIATYSVDGQSIDHHEVAHFRKSDDGQWYYVDGDAHTHKGGHGAHDHAHHHHHAHHHTIVREGPKIGRNDPCPCGSGKKYKKCCASAEA
jgi:SEC-C motif-containing protein